MATGSNRILSIDIHPLFDSTTIIVGQSPKSDVAWLKLQEGVHYSLIIDLSDWFKTYNYRYSNMSYFSLAHEADVLLRTDLNAQNGRLATQDAKAAMQLYLKYKDNEKGKDEARRRLLLNRPRPTPARAWNYKYEGVCLVAYFKQMCTCHRPSLSNN